MDALICSSPFTVLLTVVVWFLTATVPMYVAGHWAVSSPFSSTNLLLAPMMSVPTSIGMAFTSCPLAVSSASVVSKIRYRPAVSMFRVAEYPFSSDSVISPNVTAVAAFFSVSSLVRSLTNVRTEPVHGLEDVLLS